MSDGTKSWTITGNPRAMGMEMAVDGYRMALEMSARIKKKYREESLHNAMGNHYMQAQFFARRLFHDLLGDDEACIEYLAGYETVNPSSAEHRAKMVKERLAAYGDKNTEVIESNGAIILVKASELAAAIDQMTK